MARGNREFVQFLNDDDASAEEPWVKVRWINVTGISWDVISALAIKYGEWFGYRISIYFLLTLFFRPLIRASPVGVGGHFAHHRTKTLES